MCVLNFLSSAVHWLNDNQGFAMVITTLAYVSATFIIIRLQRKQLKYMIDPNVIIYIPVPYDNKLFLVLKNIGGGIARNIKVKFEQDFVGVTGTNLKKQFDEKDISLLHPKEKIENYIDMFPNYSERKQPMLLTGKLEYQRLKGRKKFKYDIRINLETYKDLIAIKKVS